ncbi:MAG: DUF1850 domain-containing protein [Candidatus Competibacteraceae bacterium]|nr:DUF1850 domain-containing protein [Candidatus Competibacteraceae bacterium]
MTTLCLGLAGAVWAALPLEQFTLAWNHTVEKIRWEEDYRITPAGLTLEEARVQGSGAGMEIPEDAVWQAGAWRYQRTLPPLQPLRLARTPEAGDYQLCSKWECRPLSAWLGPPRADRPLVELWSCAPHSFQR